MVATRRRTRVSSPTKKSDEAAEIPVSSIRITRQRTVIATFQPQSEHTSDSQQDEAEQPDTAPAESETLQRRETRRSKRQPTDKQPESSEEADVSESESCCSVASAIQLPSRSKRRATVRAKATAVDDQGTVSTDASSAKTPRRSMRVKKKPALLLESTTLQEDEASEAESCSSVPPLSTRITRSCRRPAVVPEDVTHSEAESCSSVVSGPRVSTVRRSTRSRVKVIKPIPIDLEQRESAEVSTALEPRQTRGRRGKLKSAEEHQANDSDGCQSGPSFSPRRRTRTASRIADSDSESGSTAYTSLDSPCGARGKETPSSSRTGSASSNCAVRVSRSRSVGVTGNMPSMSSPVPKSVGKDAEETEPKNNQSATTPAVPEIGTKSDLEHVEEMEEEEANNKTITADQDCSVAEGNNGDLTLTLDETEVQKQDVSSEAEEDVEIAHEASGVRQVQAMEDESNSKPEISENAQHEPQSNRTEEPDTKPMISNPAEREDKLKVLNETVETLNLSKISDTAVDEDAVPVDQGAANKDASKDVKTQSSEASKMSTRKSEPMKGCISLLDSSEDEESNDGLSADGGNDMAGDLESEDEMSCSEEQPGSSSAQHTHLDSGLFVIDTRPGCQPSDAYYIEKSLKETDDQDAKAVADEDYFVDEEGEDDDDDDDDDDEEDEDTNTLFSTRKPAVNEFSSSIDPGLKVKALGGLYINFDGSKSKCLSDNLKRLKDQKNQDELLKKSVIVPDFEKKDCVPPYKESKHAAKLKRRAERAKTTGGGWFNMRAPELTEDLKNDLKVLQMRSAIDPKRFYKKNDREGFPKYFQVGTVVDNPIDFYHSRIPKKDRKRTIVEELLADAEFRSFNKRKYREVMAEKAAAAAGKLNKKKKKINK